MKSLLGCGLLISVIGLVGCGGGATNQPAPNPNPGPPPPPSTFISVLTGRNDNARTSLNPSETVLTPSNVNKASFGKIASYPIDGLPFAQPLVVPGVPIPGKGTFDVVYVATENDSVYAFDANGKASGPLWQDNFLSPGVTVANINGLDLGITSTPVIDFNSGVLYVVAFTTENGVIVERLHALEIATGNEMPNSPVVIAPPGFDPSNEANRPALLLANSTVYVAYAGINDPNVPVFHGWVLGFDYQTLLLKNVWNTTPNGVFGGIWQSGSGLAADAAGNVYAVTGNGTFDGGSDYGDSIVKLDPNLNVLDSFTPSDQAILDVNDWDLGSAGLMLIPGTSLGVMAGKEGTIYLVDRSNMGTLVQQLPDAVGIGQDERNFSTATFFNGNVYFIGVQDTVKQFSFNGKLSAAPVAVSAHVYGERGAQSAVSANGGSDGILWVSEWTTPDGINVGPGTLWAYDATNVGKELYDSNQAGSRDTFGPANKFTVPTVANGKVYLGAYTQLVIFGLL